MKNIYILCLWLGWCVDAHAQTITVKDLESQLPIEMVTLISTNPKAFVGTNARGQADISAFIGSEKIEIRTLGHKTQVKSYAQLIEEPEIYLEPSNLNLDEVVISGTRWRQVSTQVPSKITAISSKQVELQTPQTAADLLGISGKVYVQKSQQGGGSPMIRGFATNRLLYTVDGVRMNTAIFRGGNLQNIISLDPFATESTEVLFGPGSVIYGSDAIGGVMSFQTLTPQLSLVDKIAISGKALTRFSSANLEKTGHFDVNMGWKKWAMVSSFSYWNFDHLRQGSHGPDDYIKAYHVERLDEEDRIVVQEDPLLQIPSAYSQLNMMQKVRYKPDENWDIQYGFHYSETSPYGRYDRHNRVTNGTARYAEWNYGPQKWMMNNLTVSHQSSGLLYDQLTVRLAQQTFEESRIDRAFNKTDRMINTEEVVAYSVNLDLVKSVGDKHTFYYGAEYVINEVASTGQVLDINTRIATTGPARYPQSTWRSMAIYLNEQWAVSEKFTVQAGLRYSRFLLEASFNDTFYPFPFTEAIVDNGALTGSLGGVYRPNESWVFSLNAGTAFRAPNVDDIGKVFDSEPGAVTIPNPDLSAEYAYNLDLGIAKLLGDNIKLDLTGYYTRLTNAMVRRNFQLNGQDSIQYGGVLSQVQAIQNAAKARVYGLQLGVEVKLPAGFKISSDLNYQVGEEELGDGSISASRHAAPLFGVSRLSFKADKLNLQLYVNYQGERKYEDLSIDERGKDEIYAKDANGNNYAPSWYTVNFKAMYQYAATFGVTVGIDNLTDRRYRPYSSGLSGPGRNFILSLTAKF